MNRHRSSNGRSILVRGAMTGLLVFSLVIGFMMTGTRPETVGLLGVVGFFLLVYGAIFSLLLLLYGLRLRGDPPHFRAALRAAVLALAPVMLLALSSTSPLGLLDLLLVIGFQAAALFYISRAS